MITIEEQGATTLITTAPRANREPRIRIMSKDEYLHIESGEILPLNHAAKNRQDNLKSLRRTMRELRAIINTNTEHPERVLWLTFTYAENMTDPARLREDWDKAWKRFLYHFRVNGIDRPEYIIAAEPQARGAWHLHALLIFPHHRPYIANADTARIWRHGFTKTKALKDGDNIAGYLCAYLCDIDLREIDNTTEKSIIKGGRLYLYPVGFRLYRCSRGIARPKRHEATAEEAEAVRSAQTCTGEYTIKFEDSETGYRSTITKEWYRKPKERQGENEQGEPAGRQDAGTVEEDGERQDREPQKAPSSGNQTRQGNRRHQARNRERRT